jgi:hypothetical protein
MKKILVLFASILCLVFSIKASAQTGCIKYYGPGFDAVYYPTPLGGANGTYGPRYGGTATLLPLGCYPTEPSNSSTRECSLYNISTGTYNLGGLLIQNHIECPIDTYLPFFVLLASCLGAGFVRNRMVVGFLR